jgi:non-heme chloroperoxidase
MKSRILWIATFIALSASALQAQDKIDSSSHSVQFVTVEKDIKLEVLDWGGTGRPLIFLTGFGNDAHVYDKFAPKFTANYHVYGITRRGFGVSSKPAPISSNYAADRLGDDVLAVIDFLKLNRPILVGHSIAGEELSSIGSRYPEKVTALIYLDAAGPFAYYDRSHGDMVLDMLDVKKRIDEMESGEIQDLKQTNQDMLTSVSQLEKDLQQLTKQMATMPSLPPPPPFSMAVTFGAKKFTEIHVPILAIFACPHNFGAAFKNDPAAKASAVASDLAHCSAQADAFTAGIPSAHVVRVADADHYIFNSNEADVIREMNAFLEKLP